MFQAKASERQCDVYEILYTVIYTVTKCINVTTTLIEM